MLAFILSMLIGGTVVPQTDYPEIVMLTVDGGKAMCSGTAIAPRVVLTAGHCVLGDGMARFKVGEKHYSAHCEASPQYQKTSVDNDMALCLVDDDLEDYAAAVSSDPLPIGSEVLLTGYGCVLEGGGGADGQLRVGKAVVKQMEQTWFETVGPVALCFGDSGSSAQLPGHVVAGVNSRGDIKSLSLMTALWLPDSQAFLRDWMCRAGL